MMTIGEQRHAAVVEAQLRRIADALETIARAVDGEGEVYEQEQEEQANEQSGRKTVRQCD